MSTIHQIYCTHCTHGSSALERRQGELADRVLGYSARGGSLQAASLRRYYRQVERYVYYYLPRDTPAEAKLRLNASSAPRRLVRLSSADGLQLVAQVCYRPTDTQGRPGSYFAHVLFWEQRDGRPRGSSLECLKLWGAPGWVEEDSPDIPFLLEPLGSLDAMLGRRRAALDDDVLLSFLQSPPGGPFDDPGRVIPSRWRQKPAGERVALVRDALLGFLQIDGSGRESLLLVIEPSVAALVFYGIARLLPEGGLREAITFSTFEPNPDRLCTTLAATQFHDCQATDLAPEVYRSGSPVFNTFLGHCSQARRADSPYADALLGRLLEKGWAAVDRTLDRMRAAGARRADDLQRLAAVDRVVPVLLQTGQSPAGQPWRSSPVATGYLRQALAHALGELSSPEAQLAALVGRPAQLTILELAAGPAPLPGTEAAVQFLVAHLPEPWIVELLRLEGVASERKVEVLAGYVAAHAGLPPGCEAIWSEASRPPKARTRADDELLLPQVLARLDLKTLERFYRQVADQHRPYFFTALRDTCRRQGSNRSPLTRIVERTDDDSLVSLLGSLGPGFFKEYPADEPALGRKLHGMLQTLPEHLGQFEARLDAILAGEHLLPEPADRRTAAVWGTCRQTIAEVGGLQSQKSGLLRRGATGKLEDACRRMSQAAAAAMPPGRFPDDRRGTRKQEVLRKIGPRVLGGRKLLPPGPWQHAALWQKILWQFETGEWPSAPLERMRRRSASAARTRGIVGAVLILGLVAAALAIWGFPKSGSRQQSPPEAAQTTDDASELATQAATGTPAERAPQHQAAPPKAAQPDSASEHADAAEAARLAAERQAEQKRREEEAMRLAEQEAARKAALDKAAAEQAEAEAAEREKEREKKWRAAARGFAEQNHGRFVEAVPVRDGDALLLPGTIQALAHPPTFYLGAGRLVFDDQAYAFGTGFEGAPPATRQQIPQLAEKLGLQTVYVEIRACPSGHVLAVRGQVPPASTGTVGTLDAKREALESRAGQIRAQLIAATKRTAPEEEKDKASKALGALIGAQNLPSDQVLRAARQRLDEVDRQIDRIKSEIRQQKVAANLAEREALEDLRRRCVELSCIVYQLPGAGDAAQPPPALPGKPDAPAPADKPAPPAKPDAAPPVPASVPKIGGQAKVEQAPARGLAATAKARIRPMVVSTTGRPLPGWFKRTYVVGCRIREHAAGGNVRPVELHNLDDQPAAGLLDGASKAEIRFRFLLPSDDLLGTPREAAATDWQTIQPIEKGRQYTIKLGLTPEQLESLRKLAGGVRR